MQICKGLKGAFKGGGGDVSEAISVGLGWTGAGLIGTREDQGWLMI